MSADEVRIEPADDGRAADLYVRAQPGARRRGVAGTWNGHLKLAVPAPAVEGRANHELVRLAAELFELRPSEVALVRGHSARQKTLRLALPPEVVRERLARLLHP
ncbi:MAG: DUF167 domain-containing protein [Planctomycetota bacterium]|nr:DUF167 domain-containing protein [Planctomycetota bacterium]